MPHPSLHDDGQTVTLDLHGARVEEALDLTARVLQEAARRGRRSVKVIHGHATSRRQASGRTIKRALHDLLDRGRLGPAVADAWRAEGHLLLALDVTAALDPTPIRLLDVLS